MQKAAQRYLDDNQGGSSSDSHRLDKNEDDTNETYLEYRHDHRLPVSKGRMVDGRWEGIRNRNVRGD